MINQESLTSTLEAELFRLKFTLDHVGAYVFTKDTEGRYTYANRMVCELFGQPLTNIVGSTDEKFFDLTTSNQLRQHDRRVLDHGERIEEEELNIIAETGEERIYWTVKVPVYDDEGRINGLCGISTDITERRRMEMELEEQKNLLSLVLENIDSYVYMKSRDRRYLYVNGMTAGLYGVKAADAIGQSDNDLLSPETAKQLALLDNQVLTSGEKVAGEETIQDPSGQDRHYWSIKIPLFKDGKVDGLIGISTDISEVVRLKNEFHNLARTDTLTGVLSRGFLIDYARNELKTLHRRNTHLALLALDIDYLKSINDTYGHGFGDTCIKAIVDACYTAIRESDLFGRIGGDEFIIVINGTNEAGMAAAADRLQEAVGKLSIIAPDGTNLALSLSIGAALSSPSSSIDSLMSDADDALYRAKADGRGCWRTSPVT